MTEEMIPFHALPIYKESTDFKLNDVEKTEIMLGGEFRKALSDKGNAISKSAEVLENEIEHLKKLEENNYIVNEHLSVGDIIFLDKINQEGIVDKKTNVKTWINLKNINVRICI